MNRRGLLNVPKPLTRVGAVAVTAAISRIGPSDREGYDEIKDFVGSTFPGGLHFVGVYVACDPRGVDQTRVVKGIYQKAALRGELKTMPLRSF